MKQIFAKNDRCSVTLRRWRYALASNTNTTLAGKSFSLTCFTNLIFIEVEFSSKVHQECSFLLRLINLLFKDTDRRWRRPVHNLLVEITCYIFLLLHFLYVFQSTFLIQLFFTLFCGSLSCLSTPVLVILYASIELLHELFIVFESIDELLILLHLEPRLDFDHLQELDEIGINAFYFIFDRFDSRHGVALHVGSLSSLNWYFLFIAFNTCKLHLRGIPHEIFVLLELLLYLAIRCLRNWLWRIYVLARLSHSWLFLECENATLRGKIHLLLRSWYNWLYGIDCYIHLLLGLAVMWRFTSSSWLFLSLTLHPCFIIFKDLVDFENCVDDFWYIWVILWESKLLTNFFDLLFLLILVFVLILLFLLSFSLLGCV